MIGILSCKPADFAGGGSKKSHDSGSGSAAAPAPAPTASSTAPANAKGFDIKIIRRCTNKGTFYPFVAYNCVRDADQGVIVKLKDDSGKITVISDSATIQQFRTSITSSGSIHLDVPAVNYKIVLCDAAVDRCKDTSRFDFAGNTQFNENGSIGNGSIVFDPETHQIDATKTAILADFVPKPLFTSAKPDPNCDVEH